LLQTPMCLDIFSFYGIVYFIYIIDEPARHGPPCGQNHITFLEVYSFERDVAQVETRPPKPLNRRENFNPFSNSSAVTDSSGYSRSALK